MAWARAALAILALSFVFAVAGVSGAFEPRPLPTPSCLPIPRLLGAPAPIPFPTCCRPGPPTLLPPEPAGSVDDAALRPCLQR